MNELEDVDCLDSPRPRRLPLAAVVAGAVVAAVCVVAVGDLRPHHPQPAAQPASATGSTPVPSTTPAAAVVARGEVFVEPLGQCLRTDHRSALQIAMAVTDLGNDSVEVVDARLDPPVPGLRLVGVRFGQGNCAERQTPAATRLRPSGRVVVAMHFAVGPGCPRIPGDVGVVLSFASGGQSLRAESSAAVNVSRVRFEECDG